MLHLQQEFTSKNRNIVKYYHKSWIFSIITPVFSVTWSFRNQSNVMIWCSRNIFYYQCWKQLCCLIFLWIFFLRFCDE